MSNQIVPASVSFHGTEIIHIERVRDMADNLTVIYRDINQSLNKIGNVAAILNSSEYKDRRLAVHKR